MTRRADATGGAADPSRTRRRLGLFASATAVLILMIGLFSGLAPAASAAGAAINQCNGTGNVGGLAVDCDVTIHNQLNVATGVASSTVTVRICHGAAHAPPTCTNTTTPSDQLTASVTQCNGSGNGGGGTVTCTVHIINTITGSATTGPATVNQCNEAGTGGGTAPTTQCNPTGSTTNATITQCNQSGNGGGGVRRVKCTVTASTSTAALPVTINQCIGSGNGGGATVTCSSSIVNDILPGTGPTTTATATTGPTTTATSTRTRPSGTVRPTTATRPTTSASATTTPRSASPTSGRVTATTGRGTATTAARSTSPTAAINAVTSGSNGTSSTATATNTALASTGVPAARQTLLAVALLCAGAALMLGGRRPRWVGKHR